ncbi:MAG: transposase [Burkholderiales bacterium]|nr:transposase [Burkholderiales bacterium]
MLYRRAQAPGGTFFFTVNLLDRTSDALVREIGPLRQAFRSVQERHPFSILAIVIMPDHLHTIWELPEGDGNYAMRWNLIKGKFSRSLPKIGETVGASRQVKRERGIWQRRYWEHQIRDDVDLMRHVDYIHFNPVKHGYVVHACDWPYSSIHRAMKRGDVQTDLGSCFDDGEGFGE